MPDPTAERAMLGLEKLGCNGAAIAHGDNHEPVAKGASLMAWSLKRRALATISVMAAVSGAGLVAPTPALASEAAGCVIWADPPRQTSSRIVHATGHRAR